MDELHKQVLDVLRFEARQPIPNMPTDYTWVLMRNGVPYTRNFCLTEADAWAQAPTLRDLREALELHLTRVARIGLNRIEDDWQAYLEQFYSYDADGNVLCASIGMYGSGKMPSEAIAALFVAACEAGLIDPKTVVLP